MKAVMLISVGLLAGALPSSAQFLPCAADTHLSRKGDFLNGTTAAVDSGVWEWEIGSGNTYTNIQGISADGLFYATVPTSNPAYALGAFDTVNLIVGRLSAVLPGPPPTMQRPYAQEVELLFDACAFDPADYGLVPGAAAQPESSAYCTLGTQFYARWMIQYADPHDLADYYINLRQSLSGWDLAAHVRAARLAGFDVYSVGIVEQLLARRADWEHVLYGGWDYTESSWGALLRAMLELHAAGDLPPAMYTEALAIADLLIAAQAVDGSWGGGDYQATSYAILGLRADPWNFTLPWQQAIIRGVDFLHATVSAGPTCGWSYPPEYGEMNSEAIAALAVVQSLPFVDGFETGNSSAWSLEVPAALAPRGVSEGGGRPAPAPAARPFA